MTVAVEQLCAGLELDLGRIRLEHLAVRTRLEREDTAENRAAEADCRARRDVVLDLLLELEDDVVRRQLRPGRPRRMPAPGPTG